MVEGRAVDEIHAGNAEGFLLEKIFGIQHADMEDDVAEFCTGGVLETEAHPAMGFIVAAEAAGSDGICKNKESPIISCRGSQAFDEELFFVFQHGLQALAAHIPSRGAIDGIAEGHVVGRHGFCNRSSCTPCGEKLAGHFLPRSDFGECAVESIVQIHPQRLASGPSIGVRV